GTQAPPLDPFAVTGGLRSSGGYPDIDGLFREQSVEVDPKRRQAMLHRIQQLMHERVMFAPILEPAFLSGVGPRVEQSALGMITGHAFAYPYEEIRLNPRRP